LPSKSRKLIELRKINWKHYKDFSTNNRSRLLLETLH